MTNTLEQSIRAAIGAHGVWKMRLKVAVSTGKADVTPEKAACDDQCDFGRWLYGPAIPADVRRSAVFSDVQRKHAEFHRCAGQVLTESLSGRTAAAEQRLATEFNTKSTALAAAMQGWLSTLASRKTG